MNFFTDHDVYGQTIRFLRANGHAVTRAQDVGLASAEDSIVLQYAASSNLILITRDKGFGALVFKQQATSRGVSSSVSIHSRYPLYIKNCFEFLPS